jgi:hypothetical protein
VPRPASDAAGPHRHAAPEPGPADPARTEPARADETTLLPAVAPEADRTPVPSLAAIAAAEGRPTELVWLRVRRGQRLVATLRTDGLIELPGGGVHADPGAAATEAADLERPTDGWRVWRVGGDDGPTLGEAAGVV